jgi:hypothetical protein
MQEILLLPKILFQIVHHEIETTPFSTQKKLDGLNALK